MNLVDKEHSAFSLFEICQNRFESLLKIAPVLRTGKQRTHIQRINDAANQCLRDFPFNNLSGKTLGDSCFANPGLTHVERIILASATQNLHGARDFKVAADQRINFSGNCLFIEIYRKRRQGILKVLIRQLLVRFIRRGQFPWRLIPADTVRNVVHNIESRDALLT